MERHTANPAEPGVWTISQINQLARRGTKVLPFSAQCIALPLAHQDRAVSKGLVDRRAEISHQEAC